MTIANKHFQIVSEGELALPAAQQAAFQAGIEVPDVVENPHDAGFSMIGQRNGMKALLLF